MYHKNAFIGGNLATWQLYSNKYTIYIIIINILLLFFLPARVGIYKTGCHGCQLPPHYGCRFCYYMQYCQHTVFTSLTVKRLAQCFFFVPFCSSFEKRSFAQKND